MFHVFLFDESKHDLMCTFLLLFIRYIIYDVRKRRRLKFLEGGCSYVFLTISQALLRKDMMWLAFRSK